MPDIFTDTIDTAFPTDPALGAAPANTTIERERPEPPEARANLVKKLCKDVREAREYWTKKAFTRMREDMAFAAGRQWEADNLPDQFADAKDTRYVANIVLRHIQQRTANLYGKNPKIVARRKERLLATVWDGTFQSLKTAMLTLQAGMPDPMAMMIVQDAQAAMQTNQKLARIGKTLEVLFEHEISEQSVPFKVQMKATIRKALTCGVGYVKLGYQRVMGKRPEVERAIADASERLAALERMSADIADDVVAHDSPEAEQLRLTLQSLAATPDIVVREGLTISYPDSTSIIPDKSCKQLRGFVGCDRVTEEYFLTRERIEEIYGKDVGTTATAYTDCGHGEFKPTEPGGNQEDALFAVWEVYDRKTGLVYTLCDGYPDFLTEPAEPDVWLERFWPWFAMVFNEVYDEESVFPPSDVRLIRDMQLELNRARQGLREHRRASRPKTFVRKGVLEEPDKDAIRDAEANAIIELQGLQLGEDIKNVLQPFAGPEIDPRLYETQAPFEDILRVVGSQEANLGGTSGATATETSIAEGSRLSSVSSTIDDLDEFLTELARAAGQILLRETSVETVREVVGPGAVWPDLSRDQIAKELYLDVEAASTGRPNQAQEIQNANQIFPLLMQIPGISPEWMARELLRRMDDRLDLSDAFAAGMPSVQMMNRQQQMAPAGPGRDPNQQGGEGGNNAPSTEPKQVNVAPRPPERPPQQTQLTPAI